ncbi:MAG: MFS transporter [Candidatus Lokiarchaeota archaeon]|nr:MFS transporter [Candidatus Lokiarchaeota archaeon]
MTRTTTFSRTTVFFTILAFFFIIVFSYIDQSLLSPFLDTLLVEFFGSESLISVRFMGILQAVFVFLSGIAMVVAGVFSDRTSRKWICFIGTMLYGSLSLISFFTPTGKTGYWFFFATRSLNGVGIGAILPSIFAMVGDLTPPTKRTMSFAYISVGIALGQLIGMFMGGLLASPEMWRFAYLGGGALSIAVGLTLIAVKEPQRGAMEVELQDLGAAQYVFKLQKGDFRKVWDARSNFWLIVNFIDCIPSGIIFFLIFLYLEKVHNIPEGLAIYLVLFAFLAGIIGTLVFGKIGDNSFRKNRKSKVLIALLCNAVPVILFIVFMLIDFSAPTDANVIQLFSDPRTAISLASLILLMFINKGVEPNWFSTLADVNLPENRATMISLAQMLDLIGLSLGPLMAGWIVDLVNTVYDPINQILGLRVAMWVAIGFWVLNVLLWIPIFLYVERDLDDVHKTLSERAQSLRK